MIFLIEYLKELSDRHLNGTLKLHFNSHITIDFKKRNLKHRNLKVTLNSKFKNELINRNVKTL